MSELAVAVGEVQRFVAGTRDKTAEQVQRLANVTQVLADHRTDVENILHVAPTAFANAYNILNPNVPGGLGTFVLANFSNPVAFICSAIGGVENATATETGKLCAQYLGPALRLLSFNILPQPPLNPYLMPSVTPDKVVYSDPALAPGGPGGAPDHPISRLRYRRTPGDGDVPAAGVRAATSPCNRRRRCRTMLLPAEAPPAEVARCGGTAANRRDATIVISRAIRRTVASGALRRRDGDACGFGGVNSLPLPGAVASGSGNAVYHIQIANVGHSRIEFAGDDRRCHRRQRREDPRENLHAEVDVRVQARRRGPCQRDRDDRADQPAGVDALALDPPLGEPPTGRLSRVRPSRLNRSSTYPSTEQTLSSLSVVTNAGGLGQIGDFIHSTSTALSGREGDVRELISRLDTFVGVVDDQRERFNAYDQRAGPADHTRCRSKRTTSPMHCTRCRRPSMSCWQERARLVTAMQKLGQFSDVATKLVDTTKDDLVPQPDQSRTDAEGPRRRRPRSRYGPGATCRRSRSRRTSSIAPSGATTSTSSQRSI